MEQTGTNQCLVFVAAWKPCCRQNGSLRKADDMKVVETVSRMTEP